MLNEKKKYYWKESFGHQHFFFPNNVLKRLIFTCHKKKDRFMLYRLNKFCFRLLWCFQRLEIKANVRATGHQLDIEKYNIYISFSYIFCHKDGKRVKKNSLHIFELKYIKCSLAIFSNYVLDYVYLISKNNTLLTNKKMLLSLQIVIFKGVYTWSFFPLSQ